MILDRKGDKGTRVCDECGDHKENVSYWNLKRKEIHLCYSCSNRKTNVGRIPYNKGKKQKPKDIGNTHTSSDGYPMVWVGRHNYSHGYMPVHRLLVSEKENRVLDFNEKVHHIDGDKSNYDIDNLFLCESMSHHQSLHAQLETISFELIQNDLIKFDHSKGIYKLSLPIKRLIELKSGEFMETPEKDNHELSSVELAEKVQRLFPSGSTPKQVEAPDPSEEGEDIVRSNK